MRALSLLISLVAASSGAAQSPTLALKGGGSYPGTLQIVAENGRLGAVGITLLSVTSGPTPLASVCSGDTRMLRLGTESLAFSFQGPFLPNPPGPPAYKSPVIPVPNDPGFFGGTLYWQTFTLSRSGCFVGSLSNATATRFYPAGKFHDRRVSVLKGRSFHQSILLPDHRVMIIGGGQGGILAQIAEKTTEIYDPVTDMWTQGPLMLTERSIHTTTKLLDGRWLNAGGVDIQNKPQTHCEFYDPKINKFTLAPPMLFKRFGHDAVRLPSGKVLVTGGISKMNATGGNLLAPVLSTLVETELYDPATNKWTPGPKMSSPRVGHRMILLPNGRYLIYGGIGWRVIQGAGKIPWIFKTCDIYDPKTNKMLPAPSMNSFRALALSVDLGGGQFLVSGGISKLLTAGTPTNTAEIYDANKNTWTPTGSLAKPRGLHWGFPIGGGKFLHIGGGNNTILKPQAMQTCEVYDKATGKWSFGPPLNIARAAYGYIVMPDGTIMITSGGTGASAINTATTEWFYK